MNQPPPNPDALEAACLAAIQNESPGATFADEEDRRDWLGWMRPVVSAYLAAALPEVTSVEELEALPEGTILRDSYGLALHKRTANWWVTNCESNLTSEDLADEIADTAHTYTVLYRPEVKP